MSHKKVQKINKMYKCEKVENYIVIYNEKQKFKVLDFNEPNQIKIVDISGKQVLANQSKIKTINVENLVKGNYLITGKDKNGKTLTEKFIKE